MKILTNSIIAAVAIQHAGFLVIEMFFWTRPFGLKVFGQTLENAKISSTLAANQGLYNGFLAAGLAWAILHPSEGFSLQLKVFFLACVVVAGLYGGYSVSLKVLIVQAVPAAIALMLLAVT